MNYLRSPRRARTLSVSLALLLLTPYGAVGARAATPEPERSGLCVLDFNDVSRGGQLGLGRAAASRFSEQLSAGGVGTVAADQRVLEEVRAQKLQADRLAIVRGSHCARKASPGRVRKPGAQTRRTAPVTSQPLVR